jgi:acetyl-CoA carboxylase alpha subunit
MKEGLVKRCEERSSKLAAEILDLEKKTVEINNKTHSVEEVQCQRMSEARDSQAPIVTELVEHSVENSLCFRMNWLKSGRV